MISHAVSIGVVVLGYGDERMPVGGFLVVVYGVWAVLGCSAFLVLLLTQIVGLNAQVRSLSCEGAHTHTLTQREIVARPDFSFGRCMLTWGC